MGCCQSGDEVRGQREAAGGGRKEEMKASLLQADHHQVQQQERQKRVVEREGEEEDEFDETPPPPPPPDEEVGLFSPRQQSAGKGRGGGERVVLVGVEKVVNLPERVVARGEHVVVSARAVPPTAVASGRVALLSRSRPSYPAEVVWMPNHVCRFTMRGGSDGGEAARLVLSVCEQSAADAERAMAEAKAVARGEIKSTDSPTMVPQNVIGDIFLPLSQHWNADVGVQQHVAQRLLSPLTGEEIGTELHIWFRLMDAHGQGGATEATSTQTGRAVGNTTERLATGGAAAGAAAAAAAAGGQSEMTPEEALALLSSPSSALAREKIRTDRDALVAIFDALDGSSWACSENWCRADSPIADWYGVTVDEDDPDCVIKLQLPENGLQGRLPRAISRLEHLRGLDLSGNPGISGHLPAWIGKLQELMALNLSHCALSGRLPKQLADCSMLRGLNVCDNRFSGAVPRQLSRLQFLLQLNLSQNDFSGTLPPELSRCSQLRYLALHSCRFTGHIPPEYGLLEKLEWLRLSHNRLSGRIPPELGNLQLLQYLFLHKNRLEGPLPPQLGMLAHLKEMHCDGNRLTGPIVSELAQLPELEWLNVSSNWLTGSIPIGFATCRSLTKLYVADNNMNEADLEASKTVLQEALPNCEVFI